MVSVVTKYPFWMGLVFNVLVWAATGDSKYSMISGLLMWIALELEYANRSR